MTLDNLIIIGKNVKNVDLIEKSINDSTEIFLVDSDTTEESLLNHVKEKTYKSVAYFAHYQAPETHSITPDVTYNLASDKDALVNFWNKFDTSTVDYLGCSTLKNEVWKNTLKYLGEKTSKQFRASDDNTGNLKAGGDWVLESDGVNVKDIYFTEEINKWMGLLGTITVQNANDSGTGSLRQLIADAATGDTIEFSSASNITLTSPITIDKDIVIDGANVVTISGGHTTSIFKITSGNVEIKSLTLKNGLAQGGEGEGVEYRSGHGAGGGGAGMGGAIAVSGGTVLINGVKFIDNKAKGGNGGNSSVGGSIKYSGAGGGSNFGSGGSRVYWGSNYQGKAGGFGGGGSGGLDYQENDSYGGAGGFGGGGGGGGTGSHITSWSPYIIVSAGPAGQAGLFGGAGSEGETMSGETNESGAGGGGGGGGGAGLGGALFIKSGTVTLSNSTFTGSVAEGGGGGERRKSLLIAGSAGGADGQGVGGDIFVYETGNINLEDNVTFSANSAQTDNADAYIMHLDISAKIINESIEADTTAATISTKQSISGGTYSYSLVDGTGATDNASFTIDGNELKINDSPDYGTKDSYSIRIKTTGTGGFTYEKSFTLRVNQAPTSISLSSVRFNENISGGSTVAAISYTDTSIAYDKYVIYNGYKYRTLLDADVNGNGQYSSAEQTYTTMPAGFEVAPDDQDIVDNVIAPYYWDVWRLCTESKAWATKHYGTSAGIVKNSTTMWETNGDEYRIISGSSYYRLLIRAVDVLPTYSLVSGTGDTDNSSFTINGNELKINDSPDYSTKSSYSILIQVTDLGGASYENNFTLTVDITTPVITVTAGNDTVERGATWTDAGATADTGETVTASGTVDTSTVGTYTVTYTATDEAGNTGTATRTVTVVDTTAPAITLLSGADTIEAGGTWTDAGATADSGEAVTASGTVDANTAGTYTITYTATDAEGNVGTATRTVTVLRVVQTFVITVSSASIGNGNRYIVNGVEAPALQLDPGKTYVFDLSDTSTDNHPLGFNTGDVGWTLDIRSVGKRLFVTVPENASGTGEYFSIANSTRSTRSTSREINGYTIQPGANLRFVDLSGADLSNMDLSYIDFRGANLTNANLSGSNLHYARLGYYGVSNQYGYVEEKNTDLSGADLSNISFYGDGTASGVPGVAYLDYGIDFDFSVVADLSGADFSNMDLSNTNFDGLDLTGVNFKSATLDNAIFRRSNLSGADFGGTKVNADTYFFGAIFAGTNLYGAYGTITCGEIPVLCSDGAVLEPDFSVANSGSGSTLSTSREINGYTVQPGADLRFADLSGADLSNMDLSDIDFRGANLTDANLSGSNLHYARLGYYGVSNQYEYVPYKNTDLSGADLSNISFYGDGTASGVPGVAYQHSVIDFDFSVVADLSGADFSNMNLSNTNFDGLDLTGVNFKYATLDNARFENSNLTGVNFKSATLDKARFVNSNLSGADFCGAKVGTADFFGVSGVSDDIIFASRCEREIILSLTDSGSFSVFDESTPAQAQWALYNWEDFFPGDLVFQSTGAVLEPDFSIANTGGNSIAFDDTTEPVITVTSGTDTVELGATWTDAGATADTGETVAASGTVDTSTVGTYTVTYAATDAAGNIGTATRTVRVVEPVVEPVTQSLYLNKGWNLVSFYVKPADFSIENIFNEYPNEPEEIKGGVSYLLGGDRNTTLKVSEAYWIKVSKSFTINVIGVVPEEDVKQDLKRGLNSFDLTGESIKNVSPRLFFLTKDTSATVITVPVVTPPASITIAATDANGTAATDPAIVDWVESAVATDNVDSSVTITNDAPSVLPLGVTVVTFTVTDAAGNTSTATATVTIADTTAPVITAPATLVVLGESDGVSAATHEIVDMITAVTATDNADGAIATITNDAPTDVFPFGETTVTFTAMDAAGNVGTAQTEVVGVDLTISTYDTSEDAPVGTVVGTITVKDNNPMLETTTILTIVGDDSNYFTLVDGGENQYYLHTNQILDFETQQTLKASIKATTQVHGDDTIPPVSKLFDFELKIIDIPNTTYETSFSVAVFGFDGNTT